MTGSLLGATELRDVLDEIEANQRAYEDAERSRMRFVPLWRLRRQYRICKANEPLFERIGVRYPPFSFEGRRGVNWSITRRMIGA